MQTHTPYANAHQSLETADNAVEQAQSHPSEQMIQQAQRSVQKARRSVNQASDEAMDNPVAVDDLSSGMQNVESKLSDARDAHNQGEQ